MKIYFVYAFVSFYTNEKWSLIIRCLAISLLLKQMFQFLFKYIIIIAIFSLCYFLVIYLLKKDTWFSSRPNSLMVTRKFSSMLY